MSADAESAGTVTVVLPVIVSDALQQVDVQEMSYVPASQSVGIGIW